MTTNKVCGKGKCKFTDEFCASGDCPYDTDDMLKNQKKINTSEGNVKLDDISLTAQWRKGKIKKAKYWVKYRNGNIDIWELSEGITIESKPEIIEVLAPVLSFEECKDLKLHDEKATIKLGEKIIENDKLKSLLKEWIHYYPIVLYEYEDTLKTKDIIELYDRTREILKWQKHT